MFIEIGSLTKIIEHPLASSIIIIIVIDSKTNVPFKFI